MNSTLPQYIEIRKNRRGLERAFIVGTRVLVQDIVIDHERFGQSAEEISRNLPHLTIAQVHGALAYFFENREEVWNCIHEDQEYVETMRAMHEAQQAKDGKTDAGSSPFPS